MEGNLASQRLSVFGQEIRDREGIAIPTLLHSGYVDLNLIRPPNIIIEIDKTKKREERTLKKEHPIKIEYEDVKKMGFICVSIPSPGNKRTKIYRLMKDYDVPYQYTRLAKLPNYFYIERDIANNRLRLRKKQGCGKIVRENWIGI